MFGKVRQLSVLHRKHYQEGYYKFTQEVCNVTENCNYWMINTFLKRDHSKDKSG